MISGSGIPGGLITPPQLHFRARAAKEADKHKGGKSQLGARAAGNQVIESIPYFFGHLYPKFDELTTLSIHLR